MPDDLPGLDAFPLDSPERDDAALAAETFLVDLDGYEGPLDMLLALARTQKVDLRKISVLKLAEQYLTFVATADRLRIELAADYLVMAAWLAFLKSRLLLPPPHEDGEPSGEELAARLTFQLERLEAMRKVAARIMARDQLGQDFFARGAPEAVSIAQRTEWTASLSDLLNAYSRIRTREQYRPLQVDRSEVYAIDAALERLRRLVGAVPEWADLANFLPEDWRAHPARRKSAMASSFVATLELAKQGLIDLRQDETFAPILVRARASENTGNKEPEAAHD